MITSTNVFKMTGRLNKAGYITVPLIVTLGKYAKLPGRTQVVAAIAVIHPQDRTWMLVNSIDQVAALELDGYSPIKSEFLQRHKPSVPRGT